MNSPVVVRPLSGMGIVARADDLLLVCAEAAEADELLDLLNQVAAAGGDGNVLVRRVAALIASDFDGRFPDCAVCGPVADGRLAVLVYGGATAEVTGGDGPVSLSAVDAMMSVSRIIPGPVTAARLELPGAGAANPRARLDSGIVVAAGAIVSDSDRGGASAVIGSALPTSESIESRREGSFPAEAAPIEQIGAAPAPTEQVGTAPAPVEHLGVAPAAEERFGTIPVEPVAMYEAPPAHEASPVHEAPAHEAPAAPVYATPAPAYEPPAAPVYEAPAAPAYEAPPAPSYDAAPAYEPPAAPVYEAPAAPAYEAQAYEAPAAPTYDAAPAYEAQVPAAPAYEPPAAPVYEAPAAPVYEAQAYEAPAAPSYDAVPVYGAPAAYEPVAQGGPRGVLLLDDGNTFALETDYVVGREPQHDPDVVAGAAHPLRIVDAEGVVSRRHLRVSRVGSEVYIIDLGSANGTFITSPGAVERQQLAANEPVPIQPGTQVTIGRRWFRYEGSGSH